jgi:hypothetical protein
LRDHGWWADEKGLQKSAAFIGEAKSNSQKASIILLRDEGCGALTQGSQCAQICHAETKR